MIFFTTFAPSNNNPLVRLARKRWEGRTRSVPKNTNITHRIIQSYLSMKKILIVYNTLSVGGSTTSLLSLLKELDYTKYDVDLLLRGPGIYQSLIPKNINVLPYLINPSIATKIKYYKLLSIKSLFRYIYALYADKILNRLNVRSQIMSLDTLRFCRKIDQNYDVAISFIENLPMYYTLSNVKAHKHITWIHLDYIGAKLNPRIDYKFLQKADKIVLVSDKCKQNFDKTFKTLSTRSITIENLLSQEIVFQRSTETPTNTLPYINNKRLKFISVCRICFYSKGLDRGVKALSKLKREGRLKTDFIWYIIGDGKDFQKLKEMIISEKLTDTIILCGSYSNPLPLSKQCDVFFLPSRNEGKPMAVTEAQMLGLLPIVTEYSSAFEQIKNNENGIILPNNDEAVYTFLKSIMIDDSIIWKLKPNVSQTNYSNLSEYKKIEEIID